jgi:hypothetical protein
VLDGESEKLLFRAKLSYSPMPSSLKKGSQSIAPSSPMRIMIANASHGTSM